MNDQTAAPSSVESPTAGTRRRGWAVFVRDLVVIVVIALLVSFVVKTFVVRSFFIPSTSMNDTLQVQDRILVDELTPRFGGYSRGDVVVFRDPGGWLPVSTTPSRPALEEGVDWVLSLFGLSAPDSDDHLIKRIIGTPGDHVVCCNALGQTAVNGVPLAEPYIKLSPGAVSPDPVPYDITVPEGSLWVLGDNRNGSKDSRFNQNQPGRGFVPIDNVVGRAFVITWPFSRFGSIDFHHEVFSGVPAPGGAP